MAAVALGAKIIEKHFTLDKSLLGPDHKAYLSPQELTSLVSSIRNVEKALGSKEKEPVASEKTLMESVRKKIVASKDVPVGTRLEYEHISFKRSGKGLDPENASLLVGKETKRSLSENSPIFLEDVE